MVSRGTPQARTPEETNRFTRIIAVVSLLVSLLGLTWSVGWSVWTSHRIDAVTLAEKRTGAIAAITAANQAVQWGNAEHVARRSDLVRVRPFLPCATRKIVDRGVEASLLHEAKFKETEELLDKMIERAKTETSSESLEEMRARAFRFQSWAEMEDPAHNAVVRDANEALKAVETAAQRTTPVTCPEG
jgi:hypothetical protein